MALSVTKEKFFIEKFEVTNAAGIIQLKLLFCNL